MAPIPVDSGGQAGVERGGSAKAELSLGAADVQSPSRLAVGLARVPDNVADEADTGTDLTRQGGDRDFLAAAQIDRCPTVVARRRLYDPLGSVADEHELTGRRAIPPESDRRRAGFMRADQLADHRRNYV